MRSAFDDDGVGTTSDVTGPMPDRIDVSQFFEAGADAVDFNAPLGQVRAVALVEALSRFQPDTVVDLGCGRGELSRMVASRLSQATVIGVDTDAPSIRAAATLAEAQSVGDRVRFEIGDAAAWVGSADAALCVGASHALGGLGGMLTKLSQVVPSGMAIIGDGIFQSDPDPWCIETFGHLPVGIPALVAEAVAAGWTVLEADASSLEEWDDFERTWTAGVRSLGTEEAVAFADEREREYRRYRGVLGFGWLVLTR